MKTVVDPDDWIIINKSFFKYLIFVRWIPKLLNLYERTRYVILEIINPSPKRLKGKESDMEWYTRVELKYALRHIRWIYCQLTYLDYIYQQWTIPGAMDGIPEKRQKEIMQTVRAVSTNTYLTRQRYLELLDKKDR